MSIYQLTSVRSLSPNVSTVSAGNLWLRISKIKKKKSKKIKSWNFIDTEKVLTISKEGGGGGLELFLFSNYFRCVGAIFIYPCMFIRLPRSVNRTINPHEFNIGDVIKLYFFENIFEELLSLL